ncbi:MAG: glycosyltransferase family 4 protein [Suipraeoptans sp.]
MAKIAVITMGVKLNDEKGYTRFRYLSELLVRCGFEVDLITTTFQHWEKTQRDISRIEKSAGDDYPFNLKFIYEPGYNKNIDLKRIRSHSVAAGNLKALLNREGDYDLIYAEIPPNNVALVAARYAGSKGIPFVADVNDLWPEAMRMVIDIPIVSSILFYPLKKDAEEVYSLVSGVVGTSDEYRDRPFENNDRKECVPSVTVYVGNELREFDDGAEANLNKIDKGEDEFWVIYAGTIGTSYDIRTLVKAGQVLDKKQNNKVRIKILGGGPDKDELEEMVKTQNITCVEFVGYAPYDLMAAYLKKSDITINSFVKKAPQSIVTKIGDYLASGKPMINTGMSPEFRNKVSEDGFGVNIEPENVEVLVEAIEDMKNNLDRCKEMGRKARIIAETEFDRPKSYKKIEELINRLIDKDK